MQHLAADTVVIGGGVVGLTIALTVAHRRRSVILIDPEEPGSGASHGNAGTIADYAVLPVGTPEVLKGLPRLLFDRNSPLAIRHAALPTLAPWLARFAAQSLPGPARRNAQAIAALLAPATAAWEDLATEVGGQALMNRRGCLYAYESAAAFRAAGADMAFRRSLGVTVELLPAGTLAAMEPALPPMAGAAYFPQVVFLSDPGRMVGLIARAAAAAGVQILRGRAERLERRVDGVLVGAPGLLLHGRCAVIAAGAHSRPLAAQAGDRVPLDTERGYHVEWDMEQPRLSRPTCPTTRGFYLCPMSGRLRVAGTVELGGLTAPPSPHRIARLVAGARAIFPDLPAEPSRRWMGFRPSMPDSLPVIGPSRAGGDILHAYGHGHIGLTLAPVTARIVADLIDGRAPGLDLAPYRPGRF